MKRLSILSALAGVFALCLAAALAPGADEKKSGAGSQATAPQPDADGFISLFNGKDLDGWKANESEKPDVFKVVDGNIVVNGPTCHLFYVGPVQDHNFKDFHFKAQVMTFPNSNSGIYFHTKYQDKGFPNAGFECQVNNTYKADPKKTGGLYGVKDVMNTAPVGDNEWFDYDIIVKGKHVEIKINGKTTADWTQPDDWKPKGFSARQIGSGTFALQGHDPGSKVMFRNIRVKPL